MVLASCTCGKAHHLQATTSDIVARGEFVTMSDGWVVLMVHDLFVQTVLYTSVKYTLKSTAMVWRIGLMLMDLLIRRSSYNRFHVLGVVFRKKMSSINCE